MNFNSTTTPKKIIGGFEYNEKDFENEANSNSGSSNLFPDLVNFIPDPVKLAQDGGSFFADAGNAIGGAIGELFTGDILAKPEPANSQTHIGGQTELRFNKSPEEEYKEKVRVASFQKDVASEQAQVRSEDAQKRARAQQIEQVNKTIGISNTSYEGTVNENGELRIDVQTYYEQANSALSEQEIKAQRQNQIAKGSSKQAGVIMGENELGKGGENFDHFTKATG